jgi:hypothetical protein
MRLTRVLYSVRVRVELDLVHPAVSYLGMESVTDSYHVIGVESAALS